MSPKLWYLCTNMNVVIIPNSVTLIFTAVVTVNVSCCFALFFLPCEVKQSVYTQYGHKQTSTECYCRLRIAGDIQRKVSTGGHLVWQAWCALKMKKHRKVYQVCCVMCSRNTYFVSERVLFMYDVSGVAAMCCRHTFHQLLHLVRSVLAIS